MLTYRQLSNTKIVFLIWHNYERGTILIWQSWIEKDRKKRDRSEEQQEELIGYNNA